MSDEKTLRDQYGNPVRGDLIVLNWDVMVGNVSLYDSGLILHAISNAKWYEVKHPTRGTWLCVDLENPDEILSAGTRKTAHSVFEYETLAEWDINLRVCEIFAIDHVLKRWDPDGLGFYHA